MNEHSGSHEYKDGKRFNPDCLACLVEVRNYKQYVLEMELKSLALQLHLDHSLPEKE